MVSTPLKNISQLGWLFPIWKSKKCSKPPTSHCSPPTIPILPAPVLGINKWNQPPLPGLKTEADPKMVQCLALVIIPAWIRSILRRECLGSLKNISALGSFFSEIAIGCIALLVTSNATYHPVESWGHPLPLQVRFELGLAAYILPFIPFSPFMAKHGWKMLTTSDLWNYQTYIYLEMMWIRVLSQTAAAWLTPPRLPTPTALCSETHPTNPGYGGPRQPVFALIFWFK